MYHFRLFNSGGGMLRDWWPTTHHVQSDLNLGNGQYSFDCQAYSGGTWGGYFSPRTGFTISLLPSPAGVSATNTPRPDIWVYPLATVTTYHFRLFNSSGSLIRDGWPATHHWLCDVDLPNGNYSYDCQVYSNNIWGSYFTPRYGFTVSHGDGPAGEPGQPLCEFGLDAARPNPFASQTVIAYGVPTAAHTTLSVYDTSGRLVRSLVNGLVEAGEHSVLCDLGGLGKGVYLCRLTADGNLAVVRLVKTE